MDTKLSEEQRKLQREREKQEVADRVANAQKRENIIKQAGVALTLPTALAMFGAGGHAYQQKDYTNHINETPPPIVYEIEDPKTLNRLSDSYSPYNFIADTETSQIKKEEPKNSINNVLSKDATFKGYGRASTPGLSAEERSLRNEKLSDAKNYFKEQNKQILKENNKKAENQQKLDELTKWKDSVVNRLQAQISQKTTANASASSYAPAIDNKTISQPNQTFGTATVNSNIEKSTSSATINKSANLTSEKNSVKQQVTTKARHSRRHNQDSSKKLYPTLKVNKADTKKSAKISTFKPAAKKAFKAFGTGLKNASQSIGRGISQVAGATLETAKRGAQAAISVVQRGAETAIDTVGTVAEGAVNIAESVVDGVVDIGRETVNIAGDVAREVVGTVGDVAREAARAGGRVVDGAVNIAENTAKTAGRIVEGAANTGYAILKNASDGMLYGAKGAVDILKDISGNYQQRLNVRNYFAEQRETDIVRQQQYRMSVRTENRQARKTIAEQSKADTKAQQEARKTDDNQTKNTINIINAEAKANAKAEQETRSTIRTTEHQKRMSVRTENRQARKTDDNETKNVIKKINAEAEANAKAHEQARLTSQQKREDAVAVIKADEESKKEVMLASVENAQKTLSNLYNFEQKMSDLRLQEQEISDKRKIETAEKLAQVEVQTAHKLAEIELEKQEKIAALQKQLQELERRVNSQEQQEKTPLKPEAIPTEKEQLSIPQGESDGGSGDGGNDGDDGDGRDSEGKDSKEPTNLVVDNNIEGFDKDFLSNRVLARMEISNEENLFEKITFNEELGISYSTIFRTLKKDENDNQIEFEQNTYISNKMGSTLLNVLDPKNENKKILSLSEDNEKTPYITVDKSVLSAELIKLFEDKNFASTEESIEIPVETCIRTNSKIMSFKIEGTDLAVNVDAKNIYFTLTDNENKVTHVHQPAQDSVFDFQLNPELMAKTLDQENNKYLFLDHKRNSYLDNKDLILDLDPKELLALAMSAEDIEGVRIFNNGNFPSILYTTITNTNNEEQKILIVKTGENENFVYGNFGLDENKNSCAFKKVDSISLVGEEFNSENKNYNCGLVFNSEDKPLIIDTQIASNQTGKDRENDLQYDQIEANHDKLELIKNYIGESNHESYSEENSDPNEIRFGNLNFANINTDSIEPFNSSLNHTEYYTKPDEGRQAVDEIAKPEVEPPKPDVDEPSKGEPEIKEPPAQPKSEKAEKAEKSLKDTWGPAGLLLMAVGVIFMLLATILGAPFAFIGVSALVVGAGVKVISNVKFSDSAKLNKAVDEQLIKLKNEKKKQKQKEKEEKKERKKIEKEARKNANLLRLAQRQRKKSGKAIDEPATQLLTPPTDEITNTPGLTNTQNKTKREKEEDLLNKYLDSNYLTEEILDEVWQVPQEDRDFLLGLKGRTFGSLTAEEQKRVKKLTKQYKLINREGLEEIEVEPLVSEEFNSKQPLDDETLPIPEEEVSINGQTQISEGDLSGAGQNSTSEITGNTSDLYAPRNGSAYEEMIANAMNNRFGRKNGQNGRGVSGQGGDGGRDQGK